MTQILSIIKPYPPELLWYLASRWWIIANLVSLKTYFFLFNWMIYRIHWHDLVKFNLKFQLTPSSINETSVCFELHLFRFTNFPKMWTGALKLWGKQPKLGWFSEFAEFGANVCIMLKMYAQTLRMWNRTLPMLRPLCSCERRERSIKNAIKSIDLCSKWQHAMLVCLYEHILLLLFLK